MEGIHDTLKCRGRGIEVVAVKLNGKTPTMFIMDGHIPATADAKVGALGNNHHQPVPLVGVACRQAGEDFSGAICGVIVHDDDVEGEIGLLLHGAFHGVGNGFLAVEDGNDDRSFIGKLLLIEVGLQVVVRIHEGADGLQMGRSRRFHLYLHLAVGRVHVVKLLHAAGPQVAFLFSIEVFVQMEQAAVAAQEQSQGIESGIPVAHIGHLLRILMPKRRADEHQASEVEIITDRTLLIVDDRMGNSNNLRTLLSPLSSLLFICSSLLKPVSIDHGGIHVGSHPDHAHGGIKAQQQRGVLGVEQYEFRRYVALNLTDGGLRLHAVDDHKRAVGGSFVLSSHFAADHQEYMVNHSRTPHLLDG